MKTLTILKLLAAFSLLFSVSALAHQHKTGQSCANANCTNESCSVKVGKSACSCKASCGKEKSKSGMQVFNHEKMMLKLAWASEAVQMTDEQQAKAKGIIDGNRANLEELQTKLFANMEETANISKADELDEAKLRASIQAGAKLYEDHLVAISQMNHDLKALMTEEQIAKMQAIKAQKKADKQAKKSCCGTCGGVEAKAEGSSCCGSCGGAEAKAEGGSCCGSCGGAEAKAEGGSCCGSCGSEDASETEEGNEEAVEEEAAVEDAA